MPSIRIPREFVTSTVAREGEAGSRWVGELPSILDGLFERWDLVMNGLVLHGYVALVVPVLRENERLILKVSWLDESTMQEALALRLWDGHGAVRLVDEDPGVGALLLERLDSRHTLEHLPEPEALTVAGRLLRRLAIPAPPEVRSLAQEAAELRQGIPVRWKEVGRPFRKRAMDRVIEILAEAALERPPMVINYDLHYENVLAGDREPWLVIDPKILAGDPEYGVAQLLWNRFSEVRGRGDLQRRIAVLSEAAGLDPHLTRRWSLVRVADYWLWALGVGLREDTAKCRLLMEWLE